MNLLAHRTHRVPDRRRKNRRGITLFETALATVIVGTAVTSIVKLITAVTQQNFYAQKTTTALTLADDMRELVDGLPLTDTTVGVHLGPSGGATQPSQFNDVEDFAGFSSNPPIDAHCQSISSLTNWKQTVSVTHVLNGNYNASDPVANDQGVMMDRVQVTISYNPPGTVDWIAITSVEWLKARI